MNTEDTKPLNFLELRALINHSISNGVLQPQEAHKLMLTLMDHAQIEPDVSTKISLSKKELKKFIELRSAQLFDRFRRDPNLIHTSN